MKYACVQQHAGAHPVRLMCRVLQVSPAGYYAWRHAPRSAHAAEDAQLRTEVRAAFVASAGTYGAPRVHQALRAEGIRVGRKRIARLMREDGLAGRVRRRRGVRTTDSAHTDPIAPHRLNRQFAVPAPNRVWVSDITYIPTRQGWLYLAVVLDLASRRVVGTAMGPTLDTALALAALRQALGTRRPPPGLLHHSDRGVQYAATAYRNLLARHGAVQSMSRRGNCWDNAVAESFFSTLEFEVIMRHDWPTRREAHDAIFAYIETWYNRHRLHSTLQYRSPAEYERQLRQTA